MCSRNLLSFFCFIQKHTFLLYFHKTSLLLTRSVHGILCMIDLEPHLGYLTSPFHLRKLSKRRNYFTQNFNTVCFVFNTILLIHNNLDIDKSLQLLHAMTFQNFGDHHSLQFPNHCSSYQYWSYFLSLINPVLSTVYTSSLCTVSAVFLRCFNTSNLCILIQF